MDLDFTIDIDKVKEHKAMGVNIMFDGGGVNFISGGEAGIVSTFIMDFQLQVDVETLLVYEKDAKRLYNFVKEHKDIVHNSIKSVIEERGYELDADIILDTALENLRRGRKRYGMYLAFETIVV